MDRFLVSQAFTAMLNAQIDFSVTLSKAPKTTGSQTLQSLMPYAIVYAIPGSTPTGAYDGTFPITNLVYQVTSIGQNEEQCEALAGRVGAAALDPSIPVESSALTNDGITVLARSPNTARTTPHEGSPGVVAIVERFTLPVTGA